MRLLRSQYGIGLLTFNVHFCTPILFSYDFIVVGYILLTRQTLEYNQTARHDRWFWDEKII